VWLEDVVLVKVAKVATFEDEDLCLRERPCPGALRV
jgi:hypothetical protein